MSTLALCVKKEEETQQRNLLNFANVGNAILSFVIIFYIKCSQCSQFCSICIDSDHFPALLYCPLDQLDERKGDNAPPLENM